MTPISPILAYIDPSLGSMQFQVLLAALLSASFFVKSSFVQVRAFFGRFRSKSA